MRWPSFACLLAVSIAFAQQDPRGTILGQVSDSSGAVVPGVTVRAVNTTTGVAITSVSNELGNYEIPFLLPGPYVVEAEMAGFKRWSHPNVELRTADRLRVDIRLEVGAPTETVQVTGEMPVLENVTATLGQVISNRQATDLPLRGGSLAWLYLVSPGVVLPGLPAGGPWNIDQASDVSVAGARRSFDYNVDGVSNNSYGGRTAFVPPPDMVQEVRVDTTSYDAAVGHTTGGSINISLKSGTNALRGTAAASLAKGPLITRNFFVNRFIFDPRTGPVTPEKIKSNTPVDRWWRYSFTAGGPLLLPRIYNGKNRTFWMFGLQAHDRSQPVAALVSVPTEAQRRGDFSSLLALGSQYQIYDPFTTQPSGARFVRQPVPGNVIPASRISPQAQVFLKYFPAPNAPGTRDSLQNYSVTHDKFQVLHQPVVRMDHVFSGNHRFFARYSHSDFNGKFDNYVKGSTVRGRTRARPHRGVAVDDVLVINPNLVLDVRYGFTWFQEFQSFANMGWDLTEFGFPRSLLAELDPRGISFPQVNVSGLLQLGNDGGFKQVNYSHTFLGLLNWTRGNHAVRAGADLRLLLENRKDYGNVSPRMDFDATYTRGPLDNSPAAPAGQGLASLLFGIPSGGWVDLNDSRAERSAFYSFFVQDDWRMRRNLTLNLGLRWEYESPIVERFNRTTLDFDFATPNPIEPQARAQYARAPIPEISPADFRTLGGATFAGRGGLPRRLREGYYRSVMPRAGVAWQLTPKTVVRGGFGVFFGLLGADFSDAAQPGFNQRTNIVPSFDGGVTYVASIPNPFPSGLEKPKGAEGGLTTFVGRSPGFVARDGRRPYTQRWSLNVQFEPLPRSLFEVGYLGSRSVRQRVSTEFNPVPAKYLSTLPVRDQSTIDFLSSAVTNPFLGIPAFAGSAFYSGRNTSRSQLLRPYPHFTSLSTDLPAGAAWYHALTARFDRRFRGGFQTQAVYTWSKTMEALMYLNATDSILHRVVSDLDRPHRLVVTGICELPFGRGKLLWRGASGLWNHLAGGWQVQGIYTAQSGPPLAFGNVIYTGRFHDLRLDNPTPDLWFNIQGFERDSRRQLANNIRTFPARLSQVRADGLNLWDLSAFKNFTLREGIRLQVRAEAEGTEEAPAVLVTVEMKKPAKYVPKPRALSITPISIRPTPRPPALRSAR